MDNKDVLKLILDKQDNLSKDITEIKVILAKQEENINYHVKRTDLAEANLNLLRQDFQPIKKHVLLVNFIFKLTSSILGWLALFIGAAAGIIKVIGFFHS